MIVNPKNIQMIQMTFLVIIAFLASIFLFACSKAYYGAMEKAGVHKRDILVERVEKARDAQSDAQEEFKSALEQFESIVKIENTDLKQAYENMRDSYEDSREAAEKVSSRIEKVEDVAEALFVEWEKELDQYKSAELRRLSAKKIKETRARYNKMLNVMHQAESTMAPVLETFSDNVLFLKHNLNAQAIGSLRSEFSQLEGQINSLISKMNEAIASSNSFISELSQ